MKRATKDERIKQLEAELAQVKTACVHNSDLWQKAKSGLAEAIAVRDQQGRQMLDLQERLATALAEGARMRGYIERVQEDDLAQGDLVTTGDPAGEQVLEPKRRPTKFTGQNDHSPVGDADMEAHYSFRHRNGEPPRKLVHWIRYGR